MFHLFPKRRQDWLRVLVFPFQAYVIIAFFVERYFASIWPGHTRWTMTDLKLFMVSGNVVCFFVFLVAGVRQSFLRQWTVACLHFGFAVLSVLLCLPMLNFVQA
jgi:hypothetical protein